MSLLGMVSIFYYRDTCSAMFIAAVFRVARRGSQLGFPSADEWIMTCDTCNFFLMTLICLTVMAKGCRDSSVVKSTYCSCRGTTFGSQNPYQAADNCHYFQLRLSGSGTLFQPLCSQIHMKAPHKIKTNKNGSQELHVQLS